MKCSTIGHHPENQEVPSPHGCGGAAKRDLDASKIYMAGIGSAPKDSAGWVRHRTSVGAKLWGGIPLDDAEDRMKKRLKASRLNEKLAVTTWGEVSQAAVPNLKELTGRYALSVAAGGS